MPALMILRSCSTPWTVFLQEISVGMSTYVGASQATTKKLHSSANLRKSRK
ncbi:MAG: hypothetical protein JTT11_07250 [Candidatus Brockarchaeota archaeon]|nr:hypothetical protein [Candidatus Brockarchaeota archaeon]